MITAAYPDDDLTGKSVHHSGMDLMIRILNKHRDEPCVVIIDGISRLARDVEAAWNLGAQLSMRVAFLNPLR